MKLLIIEDSKRLRRALTAGFNRMGYVVDSSGDGREGFNLAMINSYDVIVLDLMLPSMDGISILKELRDNRKDTNVLILSAKDQVEDRVKGLNLGADDYMVKPFSFDELHARLLTLMRRSHHRKSPYLRFGNVEIDTRLRQVNVLGKALHLTPKEYLIIETLALRQGQVVTYQNLENQVYSTLDAVTKNTIEVHVSGLRKKLLQADADMAPKTKRGFGYYLEK